MLTYAGVLLEWLFQYFPGFCKKLPQDDGLCRGPRPGTHFTGFTGTKVQILTQETLPAPRYSLYWLYWYKSTNTDAEDAPRAHVLIILALLLQKYKY